MRLTRLTLAAVIAGAFAPAVGAQNVVFSNTTNTATGQPFSLPVLSSTSVVVDPNGNLKVQCQLDPADTKRCVGMPTGGTTGGNPQAPTLGLSSPNLVDADPNTAGVQPAVGAQFTLMATSVTNNPETCVRSSVPSVAGWDGATLPASLDANISLASATTYNFTVRCFNAVGVGQATYSLTAYQTPDNGGGTGGGNGTEPSECANIRAQTGVNQYTRVTQTQVLNNASQTFTRNLSTLRGLYGGTVASSLWYFKTGGGQYVAMEFKGSEVEADISSAGMSPGGQQHSGQPMADMAYMTISKCQGDFRMADANGSSQAGIGTGVGFNDPNLACSSDLEGGWDNMVNVVIGNTHSTVQGLGSSCTIDKNATYYVNIVFADPRVAVGQAVGLHPGEIACVSGTSCGFKYGTQ